MSLAESLRAASKRVPLLVTLAKCLRRARSHFLLRIAKWRVRKDRGYLFSVYGVWLRDRWHDATYRFCVLGEYGRFYSDWLLKQQDCVFLDIGANIGLYSLIACKNPEIKAVYAFEPVPETFGYLVANLRKNTADRCRPCQVGISSALAELSIKTKTGHSGVSTLRHSDLDLGDFDSMTRIQVVGPEFLDQMVDTSLATKIAIKIDVEGHEEIVIDALMKSKLWPLVWNIYYEVNERWLDHKTVLARLQEAGFDVVSKNGAEYSYDLMVQRHRV